MSQKYLLPCSCGQDVPVETSQAGGNLLCRCGLSVQVPTLLKIKKLPLAGETPDQSSAAVDAPPVSPTGTRSNRSMFWIGLVLTVVAGLYCVYAVLFTFPKPQDVLKKQRVYHFAGKVAVQDSTPLPIEDVNFLTITDEIIDLFNSVHAMGYWQLVKDGPAMSMNFRENYETRQDRYYLHCAGAGILVLLASSLLISSFFLGRAKTIGTRRGAEWK